MVLSGTHCNMKYNIPLFVVGVAQQVMDKCSSGDEDEHDLEFVDDFNYGWVLSVISTCLFLNTCVHVMCVHVIRCSFVTPYIYQRVGRLSM